MFIFVFRPACLVCTYQKVTVRFSTMLAFPNRTDDVESSWIMQFWVRMVTPQSTGRGLWCSEGISCTYLYHLAQYLYRNLRLLVPSISRFCKCYNVLNVRSMCAGVRCMLWRHTSRHHYLLLCYELCEYSGCSWLWDMFGKGKVVLVFKYDAMKAYGEWRCMTLCIVNIDTRRR